MDKELMEYLNALQIGTDDLNLTLKAMDYLHSKDIMFLSKFREDVAALFYQILCSLQRKFKEDAVEKMGEQVVILFEHIALLNTDVETQSRDSNLMTIWFLNNLYQNAKVGKVIAVGKIQLELYIESLMVGLEDIHFIFKIEKDGNKVFPISRLISTAISDNKFMKINSITPFHIRMLQLAVELFEEQNDKKIIEKLKDECHLEFLDYMDGSHEIIDTADFLNYQKNGVMIFYSHSKNSVLIRHEKKSYFSLHGKYPENGIKEEKNYQQNVIGHYVTVDMKDKTLIDFSSIMNSEPIVILDLIYEQGYCNIFHQKSLCKKNDHVYLVNPYSLNDKYIIKGYIDKTGRAYAKDKVQEVIRKYRMMKIAGKAIDQITFGLCQSLLENDNVGIAALKINDFSEDDWLQNQVFRNWVLGSRNKKQALEYVLKKLCMELGYCNNDLEKYDIVTQDILPYSCNFNWIYEILGIPQNQYSIFRGSMDTDDDGKKFLHINDSKTRAGKINPQFSKVYMEELGTYMKLSEAEKEEYEEEGVEHYVIYDIIAKQWIGNREDEELYSYLAQIEVMMFRNSLPIELKNVINVNHINDIGDFMRLHKDALMAVGEEHKLFADFDSMVVYRVVHNLIWNKIITEDKWNSFYNVLHQHQKLTFSDITSDIVFKRQEPNTLYVPKDSTGSDGTLCRAYYKYIAEKMNRDRGNPFSPQITANSSGKYMVNGNVINKIVFLFDNTCSGTGTCNAVAFYLNKEELVASEWNEYKKMKFKNSQQVYTLKDKVVSVSEIIETNEVIEIAVHSYYGTDIGVTKIETMLQKCGYDFAKVDYALKITHYYKSIEDDAKKIWPKIMADDEKEDYCLFIREFNQPKKNVFPKTMLKSAKKAICIFVQKPE